MYLDIIVLLIIFFGIIAGYKNGIFIEIISIFGFVLNLILTKRYAPAVLKFFQGNRNGEANSFITYIFTFIALYLLINIFMNIIKKALLSQERGYVDKVLGAIIGALKSILLVFILLLIYMSIFDYVEEFVPSSRNFSRDSKSINVMAEVIPNIEKYIPDYFLEKFNKIKNNQIIEKNLKKVL